MEVSNSERIRVLKKALQYNKHFQIEDIEIKRKGLSYTYDTILYLNQNIKKLQKEEGIFQKIGLILGADLLPDFHKWHKYEKLAEMVHFILAKRHGSKIMEKDAEVQKAIEGFPFPTAFWKILLWIFRVPILEKKYKREKTGRVFT